jgi:hypothetical protein
MLFVVLCTFNKEFHLQFVKLADLQNCRLCIVYIFFRYVDVNLYPNSKMHLGHGLGCWTYVYMVIG